MLRADVIVFDNSPTALLAAANLDCRKLIVGNGFSVPAAGHKLADWQPLQSRAELIQEQEQAVLGIVNEVQKKMALPVSSTLSEIYRCDRIVIDSFPQFDVYRDLRVNADYYATIGGFLPAGFVFREAAKQRIVCMLDPAYKKFTPLVEALRASGCEVLCVLPRGDLERLKPYQSASFQITALIPNMELIIKEADMLIGHGNSGSITLSLKWGKPLLILPMQLEQLHAGLTLQAMGLGKVLADQDNAIDYQKALTGVLGSIKIRGAARNFATNNRIYAQSTFGKGVLAAFDDNTLELRQRI